MLPSVTPAPVPREIRRLAHRWRRLRAERERRRSFCSRPRRADLGQHHHSKGPYLLAYTTEVAWREDKPAPAARHPAQDSDRRRAGAPGQPDVERVLAAASAFPRHLT